MKINQKIIQQKKKHTKKIKKLKTAKMKKVKKVKKMLILFQLKYLLKMKDVEYVLMSNLQKIIQN